MILIRKKRRFVLLRLNEAIDHAAHEFFTRLGTLPACDRCTVMEGIKCSIRHDTVAEIPDALRSVDPALAALWGQWRETLGVEVWAAVLKTIFKGEA